MKFWVLLVVHGTGKVSTWITTEHNAAFVPCFYPRTWEEVIRILPATAAVVYVRTEQNATDWPSTRRTQ